MQKKEFLICYDYGQGGIWCIIKARSASEIVDKYPEFTVFEETPSFMNKEELADIAVTMTFDIDDEPSGWLEVFVRERNKGR